MSFTRALYYPTIDIHDEHWLKSALLFWDEINTIVPESIAHPYQTGTTKYLEERKILKPIRVNSAGPIIEELTNDTLNYLNTNEAFQLLTQGRNQYTTIHKDKLPRGVSHLFDIHPEKLPSEIRHQLRRNMTEDGWFRVNSEFAKFYMTLLASKICEENSIALLTDNNLTANFADKIRLDNQIPIEGRGNRYVEQHDRYINLAPGLLTSLIIEGFEISPDSSVRDILNFKKDHSDELGLFRNNIAELTKNVSPDLSLKAIIEEVNATYKNTVLPSYNNLKKSLKGSGIKWTSDNFIKICAFSASTTGVQIGLLGLTVPHALLASIGISLIASTVSYNEDKAEMLRANPYTYLLSLKGEV